MVKFIDKWMKRAKKMSIVQLTFLKAICESEIRIRLAMAEMRAKKAREDKQ